MSAQNIFIVAAKRTPFGSFGGSLKNLTATDLGVIATNAAINSAYNLSPDMIDAVFFGNVIQTSTDAAYLSRHIGIRSGCPIESPALTINRLCGSGFESVIQGVNAIKVGDAEICVCGGTENMSSAPMSLDGNVARWGGVGLGQGMMLKDTLWEGLTDSLANTPMGVTAENLAKKYGISREICDEYAIRSQTAWAEAKKAGKFDAEIAPVEIETRKGTEIINTDEHPRPSTLLEKISTLKPVFQKDGAVTAANASGISDGAGTCIVASESAIQTHNLTPLARIVSSHTSGCDPLIMGIGPVPAIRGALKKANLTLGDIDKFEINEAFAAQYLACEKELGLDRSKVNTEGGAIAIGHPLGASGSRILAHLVGGFGEQDGGSLVIGAACIGGGQGVAVILEKV